MNIDELNDFIEQTVNFSKKLARHKVISNRKKDTKAVEIIDKENKYNLKISWGSKSFAIIKKLWRCI